MYSWFWPLLALSTWTKHVLAGPTVDVGLRASFSSPPLIVELLESVATENSSAFLPLLDKIAKGAFDNAATDRDLYTRFLATLQQDKLLPNDAAISSWKLALSVHEAAPRIQAHNQFWESHVQGPEKEWSGEATAAMSVFKPNGAYCADSMCETPLKLKSHVTKDHRHPRPFDRVVGSASVPEQWTIYVDPSDAGAMAMFRTWRSAFPAASFRLRYRTPANRGVPLPVSGYGVELALKRTDYIVIDDREAESRQTQAVNSEADKRSSDDETRDVKPLSASELRDLGLKASSLIMNDPRPMETLSHLTQDMPKHASSLTFNNVSEAFLMEHKANRENVLPPGYNILWMNGVQVSPRDVNVFSLLDKLRRERRLISNLHDLGLSASQSIQLLSHPAIVDAQGEDEPQRYDFRDDAEGGNVILWLNNIEKDKRYVEWPTELTALLQRTFPGQLPAVRRDIHNVVLPVNLTDPKSTSFATETILSLVQRMVPVRFGLVPVSDSPASTEQGKLVYYLQDAYGLSAVMEYLELSLGSTSLSSPSQEHFEAVTSSRQLRRSRTFMTMPEVLSADRLDERITQSRSYLKRLSATGSNAPLFVNGVPVASDEDWMQNLGQRVTVDMRKIQQMVYEEVVDNSSWVPNIFLKSASSVRNPIVVPEDEKEVTLHDMSKIHQEHEKELNGLKSLNDGAVDRPSLLVFMDLMTDEGCDLFVNTVDFALSHDDIYIALNHFSDNRSPQWSDRAMERLRSKRPDMSDETLRRFEAALMKEPVTSGKRASPATSPLAQAIGLQPGQQGVLINGRLVGPLASPETFTAQDFETLVSYEHKRRIQPALNVMKELDLSHILTSTHDLAKLSSVVALSTISDVPEGIFDTTPGPRTSIFDKWQSDHTCITIGGANASVNLVASIDPVSEVAQRWVPMLKVLSELEGVNVRIFLNPSERIEELPVKRFYRQVLDSAPRFSSTGTIEAPAAQFVGIPEETLVTLAMDAPPSWLVAPRESVYDLDNIKLASLNGQTSVNASFELEHILMEGHSRDTTTGSPPRGAQLVLGTGKESNFAGTIIMANLGYFQFKANPGVYDLSLQKGKSQQIFTLDSAGTMGYSTKSGDETNEIALASFQGATIFPRLTRRSGHETADVLEIPDAPMTQLASGTKKQVRSVLTKGGVVVDELIAKAGYPHITAGDLASQGIAFGQSILDRARKSLRTTPAKNLIPSSSRHADINIFSVASGHLYERMLNIMMLSVMKNTEHTVKFWFIEQFLSPSFKTFLPAMAAEYGFDFEMVTYKWPHWLRAQKEKQRVIWGYKILFLDVLFPLDLDKVIYVDADQVVRTDMYDLVKHYLEGAPYGFTPMCDSRTEMEGYRFWKQGYWKNFLRGLPYHISALYVVDLKMFRAMAAGDRLRGQYQSLSADPNSLSNLDQDLPNHMQMNLPIHSLPQEWLWCETWCDDESLKVARTIDLCNNPETKEPKLSRARRQLPEWTTYDDEIAALARRKQEEDEPAAAGIAVEAAEESGAPDPRPKDEL